MGNITLLLLPICMAYIMFTLGLTLRIKDFTNVLAYPKAFVIGAINQTLLLPLIALVLVLIMQPDAKMAFGIMLISFCPGGITSNIMSQHARANVALSISLTSIISILSVVTVPILVAFAYEYFLDSPSVALNIQAMGIKLFAITLVPVALGMLLNALKPELTKRISQPALNIATCLFVVIVLGAILTNLQVLAQYFWQIGSLLIMLLVLLFICVTFICKMSKLPWFDSKTVILESCVQNGTLAITLAGIISTEATALPTIALPAAIYSILMYVIVVPFILYARKRG